MSHEKVQRLIVEHAEEICAAWLEEHLAAAPISDDSEIIRGVHRRSGSLLKALGRALASDDPDDWGSFAHREVVQILTMMVRALAEGKATAGTAGGLAPALGRALEGLGGNPVAQIVLPLAEVATEAFTAAQLAASAQEHMERLVRTTPVLKLRPGVVLVAACGSPDPEAAQAIVERALRAVIKVEVKTPTVILDLSSLEVSSPSVMGTFLALPVEVAGLGGVCAVTGLSPPQRARLTAQGIALEGMPLWDTLEEALAAHLPEGWLQRLGRVLR